MLQDQPTTPKFGDSFEVWWCWEDLIQGMSLRGYEENDDQSRIATDCGDWCKQKCSVSTSGTEIPGEDGRTKIYVIWSLNYLNSLTLCSMSLEWEMNSLIRYWGTAWTRSISIKITSWMMRSLLHRVNWQKFVPAQDQRSVLFSWEIRFHRGYAYVLKAAEDLNTTWPKIQEVGNSWSCSMRVHLMHWTYIAFDSALQ
jgi:hypothetical protein